jgi:beta-galactosidase
MAFNEGVPMSLTATHDGFVKDGKPYFLLSGEIHYFRIDPRLWETHLRLLKRSGANTTSTYIPWDWHEYEENRFDFSGETHPGRNLLRYIDLCSGVGLDLIVKPGPYILAEYELHGLPGWLLERCGRGARALDENGNIIASDVMSYMSEEFLRYAFHWYDRIMPVVARHQRSSGGPIAMMQVCNEVGVFQWLSGRIDYNPSVVGLYREFIARIYGEIANLNRKYGTEYSAFDEVVPPRGSITSKAEYCAYHDFHRFYRYYYALYLETLTKKIRSFGIDLQLTHNIPGWIYGHAAELPMLISTYAEVLRTRNDIVFGLDHIPEFVSFRNAHSDLACNKILEAFQPGAPVWAAEFQSGTREHHVKSDPRDMETFYMASLAHGLKGFNYYMFSQGINPAGKGFYGKTFYFQTPLDARAGKSSLYPVVRRCSDFIRHEEEHLLSSRTDARVCVGLYKPYFYTELTTSMMLKEKRLHIETLGLTLDPRFVREELLFNGLLRGLQTLNIPYDIRDLEACPLDGLLAFRQLWVVTTEFMDADTQRLLASYVEKGGHLVVTPAIPTLDLYLNPSTEFKDALGLRFSRSSSPNKVSAFSIDDVFTVMKEKQVFEPSGEEVLATTKKGEACGIRKKMGRGWVTALGFAFGYTTDEHLEVYRRILRMDRIAGPMKVSDPDIQYVVRRGKKYSYVFLLNYHNQKKTFSVNGTRHSLEPLSFKIIKRKHGAGTR